MEHDESMIPLDWIYNSRPNESRYSLLNRELFQQAYEANLKAAFIKLNLKIEEAIDHAWELNR